MLVCSATAEELTNKEILERIKKLEQKNAELEAKLAEKEAQDKEKVHEIVEDHLDKLNFDEAYAQASAEAFNLSKYTKSFEWSGDLRLRHQYEETDDGTEGDRRRFRTRFRLGMKWKNKDGNWEIGAGLATGGSDGRSTNFTHGGGSDFLFQTGDTRFDYAYAKHKWEKGSATLGQQKNPFLTSKLFWDGDLRPVGATYQYGAGNDKKFQGLFFTGGAYIIDDVSSGRDEDSAEMFAAQIGYIFGVSNGMMKLAAGFQHWDSASVQDYLGASDDAEYNVMDFYFFYGMKKGEMAVDFWAHLGINAGADGGSIAGLGEDADENDTAFAVGVDVKAGKFKFGAQYVHIEADSLFPYQTDSDYFSGVGGTDGTNAEAFILYGKYYFYKNLELGLKFIDSEAIEDGGSTDEGETWQLDLVYKF